MNDNQKWPSYCETYEMNFSLAESNKLPKQMNGNQKWPSYCETYEMNFHRRWKGDDGIYFGCRFWFHCLYEQNGLFLEAFFTPMAFLEYDFNDFCCSVWYTSKQNRCRISHTQRKKICPEWGSNSQPADRSAIDYETDALPTALSRHVGCSAYFKLYHPGNKYGRWRLFWKRTGRNGITKWILLTIFIKPFFYERFLDWHNTRFNGLTHIFFRLVGRLLLTFEISCHM